MKVLKVVFFCYYDILDILFLMYANLLYLMKILNVQLRNILACEKHSESIIKKNLKLNSMILELDSKKR